MRLASVSLCMLLSIRLSAGAQNSAPPPSPAPGLQIPSGALPYALDHFGGLPELVPVHHSTIEVNNHKGSNIAGSALNPFFKQKMTTELAGAHARTVIHDGTPSFFLHFAEDPDGGGDTENSEVPTFAIVHATVDKDRRIFAQIRQTQYTGNAKRIDGVVDAKIERLPGGWVKMTPTAPMPAGEYALSPVPKAQNTFSTMIYDFTIDPAAPNAVDAVLPKP